MKMFTNEVSILARSGDRALPDYTATVKMHKMFQSSPGLVTGRYISFLPSCLSAQMFQSSPGLVTGRYERLPLLKLDYEEFQSSPGLVTGRYDDVIGGEYFLHCFNPRPVW